MASPGGRWDLGMRWGSENAEEGCREAMGGHAAAPVLWLRKGRNVCIAGSSSQPPAQLRLTPKLIQSSPGPLKEVQGLVLDCWSTCHASGSSRHGDHMLTLLWPPPQAQAPHVHLKPSKEETASLLSPRPQRPPAMCGPISCWLKLGLAMEGPWAL